MMEIGRLKNLLLNIKIDNTNTMKNIKFWALCLVATLGMCACGKDKTEDPQPQETDIRESFVGLYSGDFGIYYLLTETNEEDGNIYNNYKVRIRKNKKDNKSIDVYQTEDGEEFFVFTARLTEKINDEGVIGAVGVIDKQYSEECESQLYGLPFDSEKQDVSIVFLGNTIGYRIGFVDNFPLSEDEWRYNIKWFYQGTKY